MIGSVSTASAYQSSSHLHGKRLTPSKAAEVERIEARLTVLEKKIGEEKSTGMDAGDLDQRRRLQERDAEVRNHEKTHQAAAGELSSGGMSLVYQTGPDGRAYAVGGSVQIDTSTGRTPEETLRKAQRVRSAALAPSDPSSADIKVAARASQMEAQAQAEIAKKGNGGSQPEAKVISSKQVEFHKADEDEESDSTPSVDGGPSEARVAKAASAYERAAQGYRES